jgi:hypothetical protein
MKKVVVVLVVVLALSMVGCARWQRPRAVVQIETNETAILIDMGAADSTAIEGSVDMRRDIVIMGRWVQTGRFDWQGHWRPQHRVMVVSRRPVNVDWGVRGVQTVSAVSREQARFRIPLIINASIQNDEDAQTFLRWFRAGVEGVDETHRGVDHWRIREEAQPLEDVLNRHIFPVVSDRLNELFRETPIVEAESVRVDFIRQAHITAQEAADQFGITIITLAGTDGLVFDDSEFQKAINELAVLGMQQNVLQQEQRNAVAAQEVARVQANTESIRANIMAQTVPAQRQLMQIEVDRRIGEARAEALLIEARRALPTTLIVQDLEMLGTLGVTSR